MGVPAILTNHNKQTYANYALSFETVTIRDKIFFNFLSFFLQTPDFEEEKFRQNDSFLQTISRRTWEDAKQFCNVCGFELKNRGSNFDLKVNSEEHYE